MVDQAQLLEAVILRCRDGVDIKIKGEDARQTPLLNGSLDLGRPHQIRRPIGAGLLDGYVVVRTSDLVLGAVLALREALVTPDVPLLASFAALARLGVATNEVSTPHIAGKHGPVANIPSSGRTAAGTSHCSKVLGGWTTGVFCVASVSKS